MPPCWPMVILTSLAVVALYLLTARLFHPALAFSRSFVALDLVPCVWVRILGHDAPAAVFMSLSFVVAVSRKTGRVQRSRGGVRRRGQRSLLASPPPCSSSPPSPPASPFFKAPALFLIPFAGLALLRIELASYPSFSSPPRLLAPSLWGLCSSGVLAYLTFAIFWPAAWADPPPAGGGLSKRLSLRHR
ncbi:MAG: hypothetical protein U0401_16445 [Anaerolineae bacterium]